MPHRSRIVCGDEWWQVFCFAEEAHAEAFRIQFGGERFDPKHRGRGRLRARWYKEGQPQSRTGKATVPATFVLA